MVCPWSVTLASLLAFVGKLQSAALTVHRRPSRMQSVHTQGIWMAEALQKTLADYEDVWLFVTHMGDPKAAFLLCFPVTYYLSRRTGVAVLWVAAISEWLNLMLKWYERHSPPDTT